MIPFKNDYIIENIISERLSKEEIFFQAMFGQKVGKNEAKAYFERILDHKWYVSERLGRDVGVYVAALDFATNVEPLPVARRNRKNLNDRLTHTMRFGLTA